MTFIEKYNNIMVGEATRRTHAPYSHVIRTYTEILQSVGAYSDENLGKDKLPVNALIGDKKMDSVKAQMAKEFEKDGINKDFKKNMKADGFDNLIKIANELKLWREFPTTS